jgi:two-component sensor histidine kinase/putative methionine-R-sulfoxide reductase with GAF domain
MQQLMAIKQQDVTVERLMAELRAAQEQVASLRGELDERNAEVQLLHEIATALTATASLEEMLEFIAATAVRVTETDSASIYVLDETKGELTLRATHEAPTGLVGRLRLKLGEGITGWVARERRPVVLDREAYNDPRFKYLPELKDEGYQSFLSIPMLAKNEVIGVLNVKTRQPHRYNPKQIRLLSAIGAQAAAAIDGARLQEGISTRQTQLSAISEVSKTITSNLYLEEILQLIVAMTAKTMNFRICSIMLLDEDKGELVIKATQSRSHDYRYKPNLKVGESVAGRAVQDGQVLTILDVKQAPDYRFPDIAEKEGLCSLICVPLRVKDRTIGVLNCYTGRPHVFSQAEVDLLMTVSNHAAIAIENAKLMVRSAIIQEMHHRVKNSLQTVASLLRLQLNHHGVESVEEVLTESINRIISIAAVHDVLSKEELDQVNVRRVSETIMNLTSQSLFRPNHRITTSITGPDITLPSHKATSVALILNELIQNAIEHGFEDRTTGSLAVTLTEKDGRITLEVVNDGAPLPRGFDPKQSRSLGLQIVDSLAREDLGGRFTLASGDRTRATVSFPR